MIEICPSVSERTGKERVQTDCIEIREFKKKTIPLFVIVLMARYHD